MRNVIFAIVFLFVITPLVLYFGYEVVPGVKGSNGGFTSEFWFNCYLIGLGFIATSAVIGPIVAQFLSWQSNEEWKASRINARIRLGDSLNNLTSSYIAFLKSLNDTATEQFAPTFLDETLLHLRDFFDIYETEHPAFNAEMHSAASNIRMKLLPFIRGLEATRAIANRKRYHRIYLGQAALNTVRNVLGQPDIESDSPIAADPYFVAHHELFVDFRVDQQLGAGVFLIHRFADPQMGAILREWERFCKASPKPDRADGFVLSEFEFSGDTQAKLHAKFAALYIEESYLVDHYVQKGYEGASSATRESIDLPAGAA